MGQETGRQSDRALDLTASAKTGAWRARERRKAWIMIGRLNHVAIAVRDLNAARAVYRDILGARVSAPQALPDHGVTVAFVDLPNTRIELMAPLGARSPIANFLKKSPAGGIHHVCYEVDDIAAARDKLIAQGCRVLGSDDPKPGAHGKPVIFLHPEDFCGTLIELEQS